MSNAMSCDTYIPYELMLRQKLDKKLLAALYEAERVVKQLEELEGNMIGFICRQEK